MKGISRRSRSRILFRFVSGCPLAQPGPFCPLRTANVPVPCATERVGRRSPHRDVPRRWRRPDEQTTCDAARAQRLAAGAESRGRRSRRARARTRPWQCRSEAYRIGLERSARRAASPHRPRARSVARRSRTIGPQRSIGPLEAIGRTTGIRVPSRDPQSAARGPAERHGDARRLARNAALRHPTK